MIQFDIFYKECTLKTKEILVGFMMKNILFLAILCLVTVDAGTSSIKERWENAKSCLPDGVRRFLFPELLNGKSRFIHSKGLFYPSDRQGIFSNATEPESHRENWYAINPYIAEFWCTLSNIGFLYVGWKHKSPELLFAGCASILSHAIPKQWLLYIDKLGVVVALSKFAREYETIQKQPTLLLPLLGISALNTLDRYVARQHGKTWSHILWHLGAAAIADYALTRLKLSG